MSPSTPRWFVPVGIAFLVLATVLSFLIPFLVLALVPLVIGVLLALRGRVGIGIAMIVMAVVVPIGSNILLYSFVLKAYQMPSGSMEPTLDIGQRFLVNQTGIAGIQVGDIVAFHPPAGADNGTECGERHPAQQVCPRPTPQESSQSFVKRIVAGPGDTLSIREGHPVVNGVEKTEEPYITPCGGGAACNLPKPIVIPPDEYFLLGDNRGASDDSRFWGPVPENWIIGKALVTYWPLDRIGLF
jgi:signal peptidase I